MKRHKVVVNLWQLWDKRGPFGCCTPFMGGKVYSENDGQEQIGGYVKTLGARINQEL